MPKRHRALVIGSGRIGAFYDTPESPRTLTHCHAYRHHPEVELVGVADTDAAQAKRAAEIWGTRAFHDVGAALSELRPDIVSLCVPTLRHREALEMALKVRPKFLFLEKPLAPSLEHALAIKAAVEAVAVPCMVNYQRRFDPVLGKVKKDFEAGILGTFQGGQGVYTKGLKNNGSHMLNLLTFLFGAPESWDVQSSFEDYSAEDPTVGAMLKFRGGASFQLLPLHENFYSAFEWTLYFGKMKVHFKEGGFRAAFEPVREDPVFPGYRDLGAGTYQETGLGRALDHAVSAIVKHLDTRAAFPSTLSEAFESERVVHGIHERVGAIRT